MDLIKAVEDLNLDRNFPEVYTGDIVKIHTVVLEGDKSRIQVFRGMVIRNRGNGQNRTFTVRYIAKDGTGVERTFLYKSPRIEKIEIVRHNKVRRAQLYYMRELSGKAARLKEARVINRNKPKSKSAYRRVVAEVPAAAPDSETTSAEE